MRLDGMRDSANVEDRRGGRGRLAVGGGLGTLVIIIIGLLFGVDPMALLQQTGTGVSVNAPGGGNIDANDPAAAARKNLTSKILASTEDVWTSLFSGMGKRYVEPKLQLFTNGVQSACGMASSAVGPFYCPGDNKVYLDLGFFDELDRRFAAPGDFAQAYVIAHEVGHHVQNLMGITDRVDSMRGRVSKTEYNALSVRLELQADFLAGVWAHHAQKASRFLEPGDIEEGLRAASAIGDDKLQKQAQGYVVPDSFTHGTSQQRVRWFKKGFESGDYAQGDTFSVSQP